MVSLAEGDAMVKQRIDAPFDGDANDCVYPWESLLRDTSLK